jgi:hypothetical protein
MSESLADRLKRLSQQRSNEQQAELETKKFQERVNAFISDQSRPEYDKLLTIIKKRVEEVNPEIGELPKFQVVQNGEIIEQGNAAAYLNFDKPILNAPNNALLVSFGAHRNAMYVLSSPPAPERYRLQAAGTNALDRIVWVGDLGELIKRATCGFYNRAIDAILFRAQTRLAIRFRLF